MLAPVAVAAAAAAQDPNPMQHSAQLRPPRPQKVAESYDWTLLLQYLTQVRSSPPMRALTANAVSFVAALLAATVSLPAAVAAAA
jgi:hypothetical protein